MICSDSAWRNKLPITNLSGQQVPAALRFARLASCFVRAIKDCSSLNRPMFGPMDFYFSVYL